GSLYGSQIIRSQPRAAGPHVGQPPSAVRGKKFSGAVLGGGGRWVGEVAELISKFAPLLRPASDAAGGEAFRVRMDDGDRTRRGRRDAGRGRSWESATFSAGGGRRSLSPDSARSAGRMR